MQPNKGTVPKLVYRKTSAEIVSEARNSLQLPSGARLVSTRRPITPNVNKRQLYGKDGPAGRPPSAFNLKYLQYETRALPCLGPINNSAENPIDKKKIQRSGSVGTLSSQEPAAATANAKPKLPALLSPPRIHTAKSIDDCE